jgi:sugar lactone lactonase YvrE
MVSTLAGNGGQGFVDGTGAAAQFSEVNDLAFDATGNIYVADNFAVRKITPAGVVTTLAGKGVGGFADGTGSAASFSFLQGIAVDGTGNVYVADMENHRIRKITPDGVVSTIGGTGDAGYLDGPAATSQFNFPRGVAADNAGNVYVADGTNHCIRKISGGNVTTVAGDGLVGFADGAVATARFNYPHKIKIDGAGNLIVSDLGNDRVRKISTTGMVSTIAGSGTRGFLDGPAATAQFHSPEGLGIDQIGNIYVGDVLNHRVRKISTTGDVTTVAGASDLAFADGNTGIAKFAYPTGVIISSTEIIYVADAGNVRIRKITF